MNTGASFEDGKWELVRDTGSMRKYRLDMGDHYVYRTEHYRVNELLDVNAQQGSELAGKRWGDGQIVGRIPLNVFFNTGLHQAAVEGDDAYLNRWLNDLDNRAFRVKEGKL